MRLLLIRHAQSTANEAGKISGRGDPGLSDLGVRQATATGKALARWLGERDVAIYSSPSRRALDTAQIIANDLGHTEVTRSDQIAEMDYGEWEGKDFAAIGSPDEVLTMFSTPLFSPPGGESVVEVATRCSEWVKRVHNEAESGTVIAVTHLGPVKVLALAGLDADLALFPRIRIGNASITRLVLDNDRTSLLSLNESQHLVELP